VRTAQPHIRHVHFADNNRLLPGHGNTDWERVLEGLREAEFDGVINLECATGAHPRESLPATAKFLRQLMR
jgi:sugar phosphate isomerase/epimerase